MLSRKATATTQKPMLWWMRGRVWLAVPREVSCCGVLVMRSSMRQDGDLVQRILMHTVICLMHDYPGPCGGTTAGALRRGRGGAELYPGGSPPQLCPIGPVGLDSRLGARPRRPVVRPHDPRRRANRRRGGTAALRPAHARLSRADARPRRSPEGSAPRDAADRDHAVL